MHLSFLRKIHGRYATCYIECSGGVGGDSIKRLNKLVQQNNQMNYRQKALSERLRLRKDVVES